MLDKFKQQFDDMRAEVLSEVMAKLECEQSDLMVNFDTLEEGISIEGVMEYEHFSVYMYAWINDKGFEVTDWSFEGKYTANDAKYFYALVMLAEGKLMTRSDE